MSHTKKESAPKNTQNPSETNGMNDLMEIRNILFGENIKKLEAQIEALSLHMEKQISQLREEINQAQENSHKQLNTKINELDDDLDKRLEKNENNLIQLESNLANIEHQQQQESKTIKEEVEILNNNLSNDLEQDYAKLEQQIATQTQTLDEQKMDKAMLSNLLIQIAEQLNNSNHE